MTRLLLVALAALALAVPAAAKKPVHQAAASAAITATWSDGKASLEGCGFTVAPVKVIWTLPDTATETWWIGMFGDGCLDSNYIYASEPGVWTADVYQEGVLAGSATVTVG